MSVDIPFVDLQAQYQAIRSEITVALQQVLDSGAFAGGPFVEQFEEEFASFCDCRHAVGVGNGTEALWIALRALDIGPGDEVITAPTTFFATAEAISLCGAQPVFVDVEKETGNIDPGCIESAVTPRTKAILPIHLFGHAADMDPILDVARARALYVVEDASQAHGASYKGRRVGSIGDAGCFSFYPTKNLGAYGEAGAVVTSDAALAERMRIFRNHGQTKKAYHDVLGWNARMDGLQAAILSVKLRHLPAWNEARRRHAAMYNSLLNTVDSVLTPTEAVYATHVYHIYALCVENRDALLAELDTDGITWGIHYPVPVHLQKAYRYLGRGEGSFPVAERLARETLSLPIYAELRSEQIDAVCGAVRRFAAAGAAVA